MNRTWTRHVWAAYHATRLYDAKRKKWSAAPLIAHHVLKSTGAQIRAQTVALILSVWRKGKAIGGGSRDFDRDAVGGSRVFDCLARTAVEKHKCDTDFKVKSWVLEVLHRAMQDKDFMYEEVEREQGPSGTNRLTVSAETWVSALQRFV